MADFLGELLVKVVVDNTEANSGLKSTESLTRKLAKSFSAAFDKMTAKVKELSKVIDKSADDISNANEEINKSNKKRSLILGEVTKEGTSKVKESIASLDKLKNKSKEIEDSFKKSGKELLAFGKKASSIGKNITTKLTLPILAAGGAAIKFAIDAEETRAKFETAFKGIESTADEVAKSLATNFGLAGFQAEKLLGDTGDLLKGFGATAEEALGLSNQVQELAVDLASYNNLQGGSARASEILTKALLGERDALVSLGIKISETDVQNQILAKGQQNLIGQERLLARATATLELAYQQTGDAQGDFSRTQDQTANQIRILKAEAIDLAVNFGRQLLPTVLNIVKGLREGVASFSALSDETKKTILVVGGLIAAIGPVVATVGAITTAVGGLSTALAFLAANPVVAVIAGVTALVVGMIALKKAANEAIQQEVIDKFGDLATSTGLAADTLRQLDDNLSVLDIDAAFDATTTEGKIKELAEGFQTTEAVIIDIALASQRVNDELKEEIALIKSTRDARKAVLDSSSQIATVSSNRLSTAEGLAILAKEEAKAKEEQLKIEEEQAVLARKEEARIKGVVEARLTAEKEFRDEVAVVNNLRNLGFLDAIEANERLLGANEQLIESLADIGYNGLRGEVGDVALNDAIERVKILTEENKKLEESQKKVATNIRNIDKRSAAERIADNDIFVNNLTANYLAYAEGVLLTNEEITAEVKRLQKEQEEAFRESFDNIINTSSQLKNSLISIFNEISNNQKLNLENRQQAEEEAINKDIERRREALSSEFQDAAELNEQLKLLDEEEKERKKKLDEEISAEKRKIARQDAAITKAAAIFDIAVNTASAVVAALPNIPLSITIGALGLAQGIAVASRPLPELAKGGFFEGPALIGEAGREFAFPIDGPQGQNAMGLMADKIVGAMGSIKPSSNSTNITQNNNSLFTLDSREQINRAAKILLPALEEEAKRRGFSLS